MFAAPAKAASALKLALKLAAWHGWVDATHAASQFQFTSARGVTPLWQCACPQLDIIALGQRMTNELLYKNRCTVICARAHNLDMHEFIWTMFRTLAPSCRVHTVVCCAAGWEPLDV